MTDQARDGGRQALAMPPRPADAAVGPQPYGPWATAGWCLLLLLLWMVVLPVPFALALGDGLRDGAPQFGTWMSWISLATLAVLLAVVVAAIHQREGGWSVAAYLHLQAPRRARHWAVGLGATVLLAVLTDLLTRALDHPTTSPVMNRAFDTSPWWLFALATVLGAPLLEESVFRGFLYKGWAASRLGPLGAVLLTSLIFTALHLQYDTLELCAVLALAVVMGLMRWWSGSLWLTIGMHALNNALAMAQTIWWR